MQSFFRFRLFFFPGEGGIRIFGPNLPKENRYPADDFFRNLDRFPRSPKILSDVIPAEARMKSGAGAGTTASIVGASRQRRDFAPDIGLFMKPSLFRLPWRTKAMRHFFKNFIKKSGLKSRKDAGFPYRIPETIWMSDVKKASEWGALLQKKVLPKKVPSF
jgi:hypothetical protein